MFVSRVRCARIRTSRWQSQLRDWILAVSMDTQMEQSLNTRNCEKCRTAIYDASLICVKCSATSPPCVVSGMNFRRRVVALLACRSLLVVVVVAAALCFARLVVFLFFFVLCLNRSPPLCVGGCSFVLCTGYPVPVAHRVTCTNCGSIAHKQHWNAFVTKTKSCPWCHAPQSPVL